MMQRVLLNFSKNVSIRKIIALLVSLVFCYLTVMGRVTTSEFIPVFSMIVGYYFGKSTALDIPGTGQGAAIVEQE